MDTESNEVIGWAEIEEIKHPPELPLEPFEDRLKAQEAARVSAIKKLAMFGLTPEEIEAITN